MQISVQSAKQNLGIEPAPHLHCAMSTQKLMIIVIVSLLPALGVMTYFFGWGTLLQFLITGITALFCQVLTAFLRSRNLKRALKDPSGLVTALLLALTLPPLLPWYFTVIATCFAMLIVRECFGGLGMNLFNPAMSGFIFLVISVPGIFYTTWITPTPGAMNIATPLKIIEVVIEGKSSEPLLTEIRELNQANAVAFAREAAQAAQSAAASTSDDKSAALSAKDAEGTETTSSNAAETQPAAAAQMDDAQSDAETQPDAEAESADKQTEAGLMATATLRTDDTSGVDVLTGATFLESIKTARKAGNVDEQVKIDFKTPGFVAYAWLTGAYILGGVVLILCHVIRFQVPLFFLIGVAGMGFIWHSLDPGMSINAVEHLLMGGTMLGAFYIVTDPVTTCGTFKGRILLSLIIGMLVIVIRVHGSYSDSVAFAVMLGNCLAPLMDVMTRRRPFGVGYRKGGLD